MNFYFYILFLEIPLCNYESIQQITMSIFFFCRCSLIFTQLLVVVHKLIFPFGKEDFPPKALPYFCVFWLPKGLIFKKKVSNRNSELETYKTK